MVCMGGPSWLGGGARVLVSSVGAGATIRARTGEIPKSRFYTDSIMVASEHAA